MTWAELSAWLEAATAHSERENIERMRIAPYHSIQLKNGGKNLSDEIRRASRRIQVSLGMYSMQGEQTIDKSRVVKAKRSNIKRNKNGR